MVVSTGLFAATALAQQVSPTITSLVPNSGPVGTQVAITGTGFSPIGNAVHFGSGGRVNIPSRNNGTRISYIIPTAVGPSDFNPQIKAPSQIVSPGVYQLSVVNGQGQKSNISSFTVK